MNSGADAESLLQSPTPGSPAARLPPLKRNSGGKAEARRSLIEVVTMGKTNKISPETAQPSPSGNTESASAPDTETLPLRGSEEAGTTGAKPGSNSINNSRRPSLSGGSATSLTSSRRASFDSNQGECNRGDAFGDSVAVPGVQQSNSQLRQSVGERTHMRPRVSIINRSGEEGENANLHRPRGSSTDDSGTVAVDKETWLSAMGELSADKVNLKSSGRKLSVAAIAGTIPGLPLPLTPGVATTSHDKIEGADSHDNEQKSQVDSFLEKIFGQNTDENSDEQLPEDTVWLSPNDVLRQQWDLLMIFCVVYNCLVIPLRMAFGDADEEINALAFIDWFVDFLFLFDIFLNFHTGFDDDGIIISEKREVRRRYLRTWFFFDLLISLPIDLPFAFIGGDTSMRLYFRIPRLLRLLRVPRALRYLSHWDDKLAIDGAALRMSKLIFMILMYAHTNACLQFFISRLEDFPEDGWVVRTGVLNDSEAKQYTVALFNALSHMLCIGYGQHSMPNPSAVAYEIDPPAPQTVTEIWITILSMTVGASLFVILIGLMSSLMLSMDRAGALYTHKVNVWKQYFKYRRLPKEIRERIMKYYEYRWFTRKVFNEEELLKELPYCLKQDVHAHICQYLLDRIPIFTLCQLPVSRALVTHLKPLGCLQDDFIYIYGQIAEEMYFIVKGGVELIKGDGFVAASLGDGSYFGEAPLLNQETSKTTTIRMASARATTYTNLYSLSTVDFFDIAEVYPEARNLLKQFALAGSESRSSANSLGLDESF